MKLIEFLDQQDLSTAYYDPSQDEVNNRVRNDTRKPALTLKHLNRLNKIRELERLKAIQREDLFGVMYALPDEMAGGGLGGAPF